MENQSVVVEVKNWLEKGILSNKLEINFCQSRSEFNGRLFSYEKNLSKQFSEDCVYLITSSFGEIGNNCFDHNLGHWQDVPGCLFFREEKFCLIVDRGQGVQKSLSQVYQLQDGDQSYLSVAFKKVITGRAPEKRGNGLKFSRKNLERCKLNIFCSSNGEEVYYGSSIMENKNPFFNLNLNFQGTLTYIYW